MKKEVLVIMDVEENRFIEFKTLLKECVKDFGGVLVESSFKDDVCYLEENRDWTDNFREIMNKLGIVKNGCKGYSMLEGIMLLFSTDTDKEYDNMYQLYSYVGSNYSRTERNIRHLIEAIWQNNSLEQISSVLTGNLAITKKPLTNRKFIYLLKDKLFG